MIPNNTKRQKVYGKLRKITSDRIARALDLADEDLWNLSLSQLINLLFLPRQQNLWADSGSGSRPSV